MSVKIQLRRDSASNWANVNPTLAQGEMGVELDTNKFKFGNGTTAWNSLPYAGGGSGDIPTKLSQLSNDVGFITISDVEAKHYALQSELPTKTSQLTNDSNYITLTDVQNDGYTKNKGTVTSVNNTTPNAQGNVTIDIPDEVTETTVTNWGFTKNAGTVKSVNGNTPDAQGNVTIEAGDGSVKTVNDVEPDANGNVELDIPSKTSDLTNDSDFLTATVASSTYATKEEIANFGSKVLEGKVTLPNTYELPFDVIKKGTSYMPVVNEDELLKNPTTVYISEQGDHPQPKYEWQDIKPASWYNIAVSTDVLDASTGIRYLDYTTSNTARLSTAPNVIGTKNVLPTGAVAEELNANSIDLTAGLEYRISVQNGYSYAIFMYNSETFAVNGTPAYVTTSPYVFTASKAYDKMYIVLKKTGDGTIAASEISNLTIEKYDISPWQTVDIKIWNNMVVDGGQSPNFCPTSVFAGSTRISTTSIASTSTAEIANDPAVLHVNGGERYRITTESGYQHSFHLWSATTGKGTMQNTWRSEQYEFTVPEGQDRFILVLRRGSGSENISVDEATNVTLEKYTEPTPIQINDGTDRNNPINLAEFRSNLTEGIYTNDNIKLIFLDAINLYSTKSTYDLLNTSDTVKNLMITGENLITWIGLGQDAEWEESSTAGCYEYTCTTKVSDLVNLNALTAFGMPRLYKKLANVSAVAAQKGSFCQVNNIITVNPYDNDTITDLKLIYGLDYSDSDKGVISIQKSTAGNVVFKNMGFLLDTLKVNNLASLDNALWFYDCKFHRGSQDAVGFNGLYQVYLVNCIADYASKDNYNYHSTSADCVAAEFNCISYGAGQYKLDTTGHNTTTDSNNGSTAHNGLTIMRFGCQYWDCEGAIIADVHNCKVLNMECVAKHVLPTITSTNYNAIFMMHDNRNATSSGINKKYREDTHTNYIICCGGLDARNKYDIEGMTVEISGYDTDITSAYTVDETITNIVKYY